MLCVSASLTCRGHDSPRCTRVKPAFRAAVMSPQRQSANNGSCLPHGTQVRDNVRMKLGLNNTCAYYVSKMSLIYLAITETYCAWTNFDNFCTNVSERKQPIKRRFLISPCPAVLLCPRRNASTQNHVFFTFSLKCCTIALPDFEICCAPPPFLSPVKCSIRSL